MTDRLAWPGRHVQRYFFAVYVYDGGRKGGAPKGATGGVWRQWTSGFYPRLPMGMQQVAQDVADRFETQAKILRVDLDAEEVRTVKVVAHGSDGADQRV